MSGVDKCYVCKSRTTVAHSFYSDLCPECGDLNYCKRNETADLAGYTALVTGGRLKIGFETALKLLRAGASVIVTTRFEEDALRRFDNEADCGEWRNRLKVFAADFRVLASVEQLIDYVHCEVHSLDILINNAAQTVRRPPAFYRHLVADAQPTSPSESARCALQIVQRSTALSAHGERGLVGPSGRIDPSVIASLSQVALLPGDDSYDERLFPLGRVDKDGQQEDRRDHNSWMMTLEDVALPELLEVLYINVVSPFLLCSRLKKMMRKIQDQRPSFIVNVSAMEGNFYDPEKNCRHPHTNMAKAALNMMTRTMADEFRRDGIFVTAVDPGYITNEKPYPVNQATADRRVKMAIDEIDGAARLCDPVFRALNRGEYISGALLKNYKQYPW